MASVEARLQQLDRANAEEVTYPQWCRVESNPELQLADTAVQRAHTQLNALPLPHLLTAHKHYTTHHSWTHHRRV